MANMFYTLLLNYLFFYTVLAINGSGPYKSTLVRIEPCKKPTKPVVKEPTMFFQGEIYNTTKKTNLMRGNFTVAKDTRCKRINIKAYYWEFGRWNAQYIMNNMGCNSVFLPLAVKATGVKLDTTTCKFLKGSYLIQSLDVDEMQHVWLSTQEYGRILWVTEFFSSTGSMFCWEFETIMKPSSSA